MFEILNNSNIIGFDTETGTRYTATDTDLIALSQSIEDYEINDYSDTYDCYVAIIRLLKHISEDPALIRILKKESGFNDLMMAIKRYSLQALHPGDKLSDYDLISKITYPRFGCLVGCSFEQIRDYSKAEDIFRSEAKENFILKDHAKDFIDYIINRIKAGENIAIVTFNMEYDFNALMCNIDPVYLQEHDIIDERLPTKIHSDKTITWKNADKNNKGSCKWVDAMLLAEKGMSIKKYGEIASREYDKDYHKKDTYDYSRIIFTAEDLAPDPEELDYCFRDVQLALWGLAYLLRQHVSVLDRCGLLQKPSDLPITCSHLYDMVNVVNTLDIDLSYNRSKRKKYFSSYKKNTARNNEIHYNPPDRKLYEYMRAGFGGGKIAFNPLILEEKLEGGEGYSLDLCSAYPYQVVNMFPDLEELYVMDAAYFDRSLRQCRMIAEEINKGRFINIISMFRYGWTARIRIYGLDLKKDMQLPLVGNLDGQPKFTGSTEIIRNRVMYADLVEMSVTHADLITILAAYDIAAIEFISGYVYRLKPMNMNLRRKFITAAEFKSGLKKFTKMDYKDFPYKLFNEYVQQELLTGREKEAEVRQIVEDAYQNSKVLFNGIYGKACQSLIHNKKYINAEGEIAITEEEYKPRQGTCYTTGRYIATYTRLHLTMGYFIALRNIKEGDLILYAHTDSLKLYLYSPEPDKTIDKIISAYNTGIDTEVDTFLKNNLKHARPGTHEEIKKAYEVLKNNGLGYLENEKKNRFCKAVVCGNMRILTEDAAGDCHITFSGINVPYVLSGGKEHYKPEKLKNYMKEQGIFRLYDSFFNSGKKYTIFESCKTTLDYKHYNMLLNPELGHICQTIKELPIEINGDPEALKRDMENIRRWRGKYQCR